MIAILRPVKYLGGRCITKSYTIKSEFCFVVCNLEVPTGFKKGGGTEPVHPKSATGDMYMYNQKQYLYPMQCCANMATVLILFSRILGHLYKYYIFLWAFVQNPRKLPLRSFLFYLVVLTIPSFVRSKVM